MPGNNSKPLDLVIPNSISPLTGEPGSALFTWPTLKASPPTRPKAQNLRRHLGLQIRTSPAALRVLHQRHNRRLDYYATGCMKCIDIRRTQLDHTYHDLGTSDNFLAQAKLRELRACHHSLATITHVDLSTYRIHLMTGNEMNLEHSYDFCC